MSSLSLNDMQNSRGKNTNKYLWKQRQISVLLSLPQFSCSLDPTGGWGGLGLSLELVCPVRC